MLSVTLKAGVWDHRTDFFLWPAQESLAFTLFLKNKMCILAPSQPFPSFFIKRSVLILMHWFGGSFCGTFFVSLKSKETYFPSSQPFKSPVALVLQWVLSAWLTCGFGWTKGSCHLCRMKELNIGSFLWLSLIVWCVCVCTLVHTQSCLTLRPLWA